MFNLENIWKFRMHILIDVSILTILLNLLYLAFFFEKTYDSVSISTEVLASNKAQVWYVYKQMYSEERFFSEKEQLSAREDHLIKFDIPSTAPLDYIGLYWESDKGSFLKIKSYSYETNSNSYKNEQARNTIEYVSKGSVVEPTDDGVKIISSNRNINWIMLDDTHKINNWRSVKNHNPIPLWGNLLIILVLIFFRSLDTQENWDYNFWDSKIDVERIRDVLLSIWVFIMPFWIIISHTLMATITLLSLVSSIRRGDLMSTIKEKKVYYFFYAFYAWVVFSAVFTSSVLEILDLAIDYSYFLFMPMIFSFVERKRLPNLFTFLKNGLLVYFALLVIYATTRYFTIDHELSYIEFFKINIEVFWHTSYLSFLILLLFIKNLKSPLKNNAFLIIFYIVALSFTYLIDARMPFLVGTLLLSYKLVWVVESKKVKLLLLTVAVLLFTSMAGFFLIRDIGEPTAASNINIGKLDARISLWTAGLEQSKENIIFGVGRKNTVDSIAAAMIDEIQTKYRSYNLHNQFFETLLGNGLLGLVLLLGILYSLYRRKIIYSLSFGFSCILLFMVESYFNQQAGIILFTFWTCFFLSYNTSKSVDKIDHIRLGKE